MNQMACAQRSTDRADRFLMRKRLLLACCLISLASRGYASGDEPVKESAGPPYARLYQVPIAAIHPEGWLRQSPVCSTSPDLKRCEATPDPCIIP
jgi:hypothetical protein